MSAKGLTLDIPIKGEINSLLRRLATLQIRQARVELTIEEEIKNLKARKAPQISTIEAEKANIAERIQIFYYTNHEDLTGSGQSKTVTFKDGKFGERLSPPSVTIRDENNIIKILRLWKWHDFLRRRVVVTINKDEMLNRPHRATRVPGVSIVQRVDFFVEPSSTEHEEVKKGRPFKCR